MKRIICSMVGLCLLAGAGVAPAQPAPSLADLARQEQARRKTQPPSTRVYTNADVPIVAAATAATATELSATPKEDMNEASEGARGKAGQGSGTQPGGTQAGGGASHEARASSAGAGAGAVAGAGTATGAGAEGRAGVGSGGARPGVAAGDEAQWRSRMNQAREQVARAQIQLEAMRTRVLNLQTARTLGSTEATTQATLQRQQQDALQEVDKLRADIERYQKALIDLESQARQAGVPPGWVR